MFWRISSLIQKFYTNLLFSRIFHTLVYCLQRELQDCESVLDLGCGPNSPLRYCKNIKYSVGVEAFAPYIEESKKRSIHTKYLHKKIEEIDFPENTFDVVIMVEVLEHLPKEVGKRILKKAENWAKKKIIISSPNSFIPQKQVDNNPWQKHISSWDYEKMKDCGFRSYGLAGFKFLRSEVQNETMGNDLTSSIRFSPKFFWFVVATLSQIVTYYAPQLAFELFNIKDKT